VYRLSIIVPLLSDSEQFEDTLVSVLQNRPGECEVLVVHRGSYADPYELQDEVRFLEVEEHADLATMLNAGFSEAGGEIIHFLLPGVLAGPGWTQPAVDRFRAPDIAAVAPVMLQAENPDRVALAGLCFTAGGRRVPNGAGRRADRADRVFRRKIVSPALTAGFWRSSAIDSLGGFDESCGSLWSDVDCGLSLQVLGYRCVVEPESVVRGPAFADGSSLGYREGRRAERVFWRHIASRGWGSSLVFHPIAVAATVAGAWNRLSGYTQVLGRLVSLIGLFSHLAHGARLRQHAETSEDEPLDADSDEGPVKSPPGERAARYEAPSRRRRAA
jgi:GT2 family glycosyltransferase